MQLIQYEQQYLEFLRLVVLMPGHKALEYAEEMGVSIKTIARYGARLDKDGWILRQETPSENLSASVRNLTPPYTFYPTKHLTVEQIDRAVGYQLSQLRSDPNIQKYLRLQEFTQGLSPMHNGLARIARSVTSMAADLSMLNQEILKLEPQIQKLFQQERNAR